MTNRVLTAIVLRLSGLLLFMKIFDHFGAYFISVYGMSIAAFAEEVLREPIQNFYINGTFLIFANVVLSFLLVYKADWLSKKLIKEDSPIPVNISPENLIRVILIATAIIWLATSIYLLPEFIDFSLVLISRFSGNNATKLPDFSALTYLIRIGIAFLLIIKIDKIILLTSRKFNSTTAPHNL